jgi:hypothetical protein
MRNLTRIYLFFFFYVFDIYSFIHVLEIYFIKLFFFFKYKMQYITMGLLRVLHFFGEEEGGRLATSDFFSLILV